MVNSQQLPAQEPLEPTASLLWPLWDLSAPIVQGFGDNAEFYKRFGQNGHNGIDIAVAMQPVKAMSDGVIRFAGNGAEEPLMGNAAGECILLVHPDGLQSGYAHLHSIFVEAGNTVKAGDVIAISGNTGATTGYHLHAEVLGYPLDLKNGYFGRIDPLPLLGM
ncbi:M23 family metallopeptidase [Arthrobacter alpinus]|uniref:M23 family metallopeptidase n=1 Tax=Arthrobacter alpinus TaxID=656366 RepID=UPI001648DBFF|nr:M23 family metallopeptidase [Arthrobacter alpinus]